MFRRWGRAKDTIPDFKRILGLHKGDKEENGSRSFLPHYKARHGPQRLYLTSWDWLPEIWTKRTPYYDTEEWVSTLDTMRSVNLGGGLK